MKSSTTAWKSERVCQGATESRAAPAGRPRSSSAAISTPGTSGPPGHRALPPAPAGEASENCKPVSSSIPAWAPRGAAARKQSLPKSRLNSRLDLYSCTCSRAWRSTSLLRSRAVRSSCTWASATASPSVDAMSCSCSTRALSASTLAASGMLAATSEAALAAAARSSLSRPSSAPAARRASSREASSSCSSAARRSAAAASLELSSALRPANSTLASSRTRASSASRAPRSPSSLFTTARYCSSSTW
mmetsp:Transcript_85573/g.250540  ORF Transcript_85573/g.250540 Transcript_85573/m.250540 type:complete len:248 (-) Transcript_85573:554-1297(-)